MSRMALGEISMKAPWIDGMYTVAQIADFMGVSNATVRLWAKKRELVPTAVMDSKGNRFNPEVMGVPGAGLIYLFSKQAMKLFLRGRWIAGQDWGDGRRRQPGDEVPEVLRI